jgi:RNA 2',3'-cyclic 3'-phosphodiesterase
MRLFVAADLNEAGRVAVAAEQHRLLEAVGTAARLKWVEADHVHLTLVFLGNVDDTRASAVVDAIGQDIESQPFEIVLEGIGVFPARGAPRVLWLGIGKGAAEVIALQRTVANRVTTLGLPLEERVFHPHLTLARWKESRPDDRDRALRVARRGAIARARVDGATLYQSRLSPSGATYTPLSRANLKVRITK